MTDLKDMSLEGLGSLHRNVHAEVAERRRARLEVLASEATISDEDVAGIVSRDRESRILPLPDYAKVILAMEAERERMDPGFARFWPLVSSCSPDEMLLQIERALQ